ncbi:MAG: phage holin family protein [Clostridiales bacterium]|nr:phage holin family protein [Clostridiales bacterium]
MEKTVNQIKAAVAALLGLLTGLWGWFGWLVVGWIGFMALDYLTGTMAAAKEGEWSSGKAREGIWHKAGMIIVVVVAAGADLLLEIVLANLPVVDLPIQYPGLICPVVLVWYIVTELGSMAENAAAMGAPVPGWLIKLLALSKNAVDMAGDRLDVDDHE